MYSMKNVKLKLLEIMQRIWKSKGFPKGWRRGVIVSIYKKQCCHALDLHDHIEFILTEYAGFLREALRRRV